MSDAVTYERRDGIGVITVNNPPVNALGQAVRQGLKECLDQGLADGEARALVVTGGGNTFPAGADIREFGKPPQEPSLPDVIDAYESSDKLVVAAIHGTALGGGLEVALGCDYRVAVESAAVGVPEVKLGLLPGAGGTQRLPRLAGVQNALEMITGGNQVKAPKARDMGIIDAIVGADLVDEAVAYANKLVSEAAPRRPIRDMEASAESDSVFDDFEKGLQKKARGFLAPFHCVKAVRAAVDLPFREGLKRERELFQELMDSPQSKAQRHVFFAEREVGKVPGIGKDTPKREIKSVGVVGAGTMGGGIAMNFLNAGIPVIIKEVKQEALDKGLSVIRKNYESTAKKGRISMDDVDKRMGLIMPTLDYDDFKDVDLVIEAVFESMDVKQDVFETLDRVCKPGAILATNTSTLDVNRIASFTGRPEDVMGMHFFSPANVMKLLENVRGDKTSDEVVATVMDLSKRIGKVGVCVGVCDGFVGNRMLHKRQAEAVALVDEGASPEQVDKVIYDFGFPMGPFAMSDLAGLDIGYSIRLERRKAGDPDAQELTWLDKLAEKGRYGQKTQAGVYRYEEGDRTPKPDPEVAELIEQHRRDKGITPREVSDQEILERCMYVMVNEGSKILEEGIAARALDVDIVWIYGYGFPVYRGGTMFWADQVGLGEIRDRVRQFYQDQGGEQWKPSPLLEQLASEGKGFHDAK
ncbi:3-hydroxyacyl-CoA dehydrogenase NAD-binding domain-containing protein [Aquisalimonas lutea]|uniref:3-hydroxyacyl-CoA dehydrogenase NAD-binding domain-containing protein n=1 Tax=Aquisalimonas lutea TaxID=1327750 RepID=UPI0025B3DC7A|nr:3-hydroxyacyl-CoA dehydrogenase NAD-binding domain-containing protein [Aquisalimonas lutea]MDN3516305.1 3-hydroxyacyl-CoA dehydrogenase NAD-binding domain-containing protein [Aquisalimonas lutea]